MGFVIAIAGKGGTGKSTIAALLIRLLKESKQGSVLAIDADPNSNLGELLGMQVQETVGGILEKVARHPENIPSGTPKERYLEYEIQTALQEGEGFDLLTMGRPEGPGCYCYVNNCLRGLAAKLIKEYDYIVVDNEAGLEHLSRRTTRSADVLLAVSDASVVGLKAVKRIADLAGELEIKLGKKLLLVNCFDGEVDRGKLQDIALKYIGRIGFDKEIERICRDNVSLMSLDHEAKSLKQLRALVKEIVPA